MKRTTLAETQCCSIARALDLIGEWWTPLILRDIFRGKRRFDDLLESLDISRNVLTDRLRTLVESGVLDRVKYQDRPERYEYVLTARGLDLFPVLVSLMGWGDRWLAQKEGPPVVMWHQPCGKPVEAQLTCVHCGEEINLHNVKLEPGPGAPVGTNKLSAEKA